LVYHHPLIRLDFQRNWQILGEEDEAPLVTDAAEPFPAKPAANGVTNGAPEHLKDWLHWVVEVDCHTYKFLFI
jgi:hypothetical protein